MVELPDPESSEVIADWVELQLILGNERMSRHEVSSAIEAATGDEPDDVLLIDVWLELTRRQELYASAWFAVDGFGIESLSTDKTDALAIAAYKTCLLLSLLGAKGQVVPKLFERLTCCAISNFWGKAIPWGNTGGGMSLRMPKLCTEMNEIFSHSPPPESYDRGVDVVGWKPFQDKRSGQLVVLVQCAAGGDWKTKRPAPLTAWCQYIHWASPPIIALAVPRIVETMLWHKQSTDVGLLLDRARLINLIDSSCSDKKLLNDLNKWINSQLKVEKKDE